VAGSRSVNSSASRAFFMAGATFTVIRDRAVTDS
jgi:hypothetical protein